MMHRSAANLEDLSLAFGPAAQRVANTLPSKPIVIFYMKHSCFDTHMETSDPLQEATTTLSG